MRSGHVQPGTTTGLPHAASSRYSSSNSLLQSDRMDRSCAQLGLAGTTRAKSHQEPVDTRKMAHQLIAPSASGYRQLSRSKCNC